MVRLRQKVRSRTGELYGVEIGAAAGPPSGTVHPILARLETVGWLTSRREEIDPRAEGRPARRYYHLTPDGAELARAALARAYQASAGPVWHAPLAAPAQPRRRLVPRVPQVRREGGRSPTKGRRPALLIGRCRQ